MDRRILVISDLHGNLGLLIKALKRGIEINNNIKAGLEVILLGDIVDNGPKVPDLVEYLSTKAWEKDSSINEFITDIKCICGNHDLMLILSIDPMQFSVPSTFLYEERNGEKVSAWEKWTGNFHNLGGETNLQYNSSTDSLLLLSNMPAHHKKYLQELPFFFKTDQYLFVHAGIRDPKVESLEEQLAFLSKRDLSNLPVFNAELCPKGHRYGRGRNYGLPDQIVNKDWSKVNYPDAKYVVVTGHNKYKDEKNFVASHRIGFHSCACRIQSRPQSALNCAILRRGYLGQTTADLPPLFFSVAYIEPCLPSPKLQSPPLLFPPEKRLADATWKSQDSRDCWYCTCWHLNSPLMVQCAVCGINRPNCGSAFANNLLLPVTDYEVMATPAAKTSKLFIVLLHVTNEEGVQASVRTLRQAQIAFDNGADGVFLIGEEHIRTEDILDCFRLVREAFADKFIGINFSCSAAEAADRIPKDADGLWTDLAEVGSGVQDEALILPSLLTQRHWAGRHFGSFFVEGFDQRHLEEESAKHRAASIVVLTPAAGESDTSVWETKVHRFHAAAKGMAIALASGVDNDNIHRFLPFADFFFADSEVERDATDPSKLALHAEARISRAVDVGYLDGLRVSRLAARIHSWSRMDEGLQRLSSIEIERDEK